MLAITRYRVAGEADFAGRARAVLDALATCPGYLGGRIGRAADDPSLWVLMTEWDGAGFYRRAISSFEVRVMLIPLSQLAIDEPGAYELIEPPR